MEQGGQEKRGGQAEEQAGRGEECPWSGAGLGGRGQQDSSVSAANCPGQWNRRKSSVSVLEIIVRDQILTRDRKFEENGEEETNREKHISKTLTSPSGEKELNFF